MLPLSSKLKKIGFFTLSGIPDATRVQAGLKSLDGLGIKYDVSCLSLTSYRNFAATDEERAAAFNRLLQDPTITALMAVKGGYGAARTLEYIDWELLRQRQLPVIGYSDVTALLISAYHHGCANLIHGPMLHTQFAEMSLHPSADVEMMLTSLNEALEGNPIPFPDKMPWTTLKQGKAVGRIIPANLMVLNSLIGTPHLPHLKKAILAIEDVNEHAHAIDRALNQLRQTGLLSQLSGLIFGQFTGGEDHEFLPDILREYAEDINGPVVQDFHFGHIFSTLSFRVGEILEMDTDNARLLTPAPLSSFTFQQTNTSKGLRAYRLLAPEILEPDKKYPLVLSLHGTGECGSDNFMQLFYLAPQFITPEERQKHPCFVLSPQCPLDDSWNRYNKITRDFHVDEPMTDALTSALEILHHVIANNPIDVSRLYIIGLSMGSHGTWELLRRYPRLFAAAIPLCGIGNPQFAPLLAHLPIWAFHGELDTVVPPAATKEMIQAIRYAGGTPKMTLYPDLKHNCWDRAIQTPETLEWLFQQQNKFPYSEYLVKTNP